MNKLSKRTLLLISILLIANMIGYNNNAIGATKINPLFIAKVICGEKHVSEYEIPDTTLYEFLNELIHNDSNNNFIESCDYYAFFLTSFPVNTALIHGKPYNYLLTYSRIIKEDLQTIEGYIYLGQQICYINKGFPSHLLIKKEIKKEICYLKFLAATEDYPMWYIMYNGINIELVERIF